MLCVCIVSNMEIFQEISIVSMVFRLWTFYKWKFPWKFPEISTRKFPKWKFPFLTCNTTNMILILQGGQGTALRMNQPHTHSPSLRHPLHTTHCIDVTPIPRTTYLLPFTHSFTTTSLPPSYAMRARNSLQLFSDCCISHNGKKIRISTGE